MKDYRIWELLLNPPLVAALAAMASAQAFKTLKPIFKGERLNLRAVSNYGGWPSSHTAFVVACALSIGIVEGFRSSAFALAAVVGAIIVYDIWKMRRIVALDDREIDRLLKRAELTRSELPPQFEGHSPAEILGGIAWGAAWAVAACTLF